MSKLVVAPSVAVMQRPQRIPIQAPPRRQVGDGSVFMPCRRWTVHQKNEYLPSPERL